MFKHKKSLYSLALALILIMQTAVITTIEAAQPKVTFNTNEQEFASDKHVYGNLVSDYNGYIWRIDAKDASALPHNFRTCRSIYHPVDKKYAEFFQKDYEPSHQGLATLDISGSAQFSVNQFKILVQELKTLAKGPIYDVDLRQESHGFFNGYAVSWYGLHNWGNLDKKDSKAIREDENYRIKNSLGKEVFISKLNKRELATTSKKITVTQAITEESLAKAEGLHYYRITATDHVWPAAKYIDQFINFYDNLPANAWLHFHCEAGVGRTTAYMAIVDIMRNPNLPLADILQRQHMIGGSYVAYTIKNPQKNDWKAYCYNDKAKMITLFYKYVQANHANNYKKSWSKWLAAN